MIRDSAVLLHDLREHILIKVSRWEGSLQPSFRILVFRVPFKFLSFGNLIILVATRRRNLASDAYYISGNSLTCQRKVPSKHDVINASQHVPLQSGHCPEMLSRPQDKHRMRT